MMRLYAVEVLLLLWLAWTTWRIMRNPFRLNVLKMGVIGLGFAAAALVDQPLSRLLSLTFTNFMTGLTLLLLCSIGVYFAVVRVLTRRINALRFMQEPIRARTIQGRLLNTILIMLVFIGVAGLTDFLTGLAAMGPLAPDIREHSLFLHYFLPVESTPARPVIIQSDTTSNGSSLTKTMDEQAHFLSALRGGITSSREALAQSLGTKAITEQIRCLAVLLNLPHEDTLWLIDNTPELKRLVDNPHLLAVMNNEAIIDQIIDAGQGSLPALYKLGDEPTIKALFDDPDIAASIKTISLPALQQAADRHREATERALPVTWTTADLDLPTDRDAVLGDPTRWQPIDESQSNMIWKPGQRFALLRTTASLASPADATLSIQCQGQVVCWLNGVAQELTHQHNRLECSLRLDASPALLVLMLDFRDSPTPKQCSVRMLVH